MVQHQNVKNRIIRKSMVENSTSFSLVVANFTSKTLMTDSV